MEFIWFWVGGIYAFLLLAIVADIVTNKKPWRGFAGMAAFAAIVCALGGALMHLAVSWLMQNPWGFLLLLSFIFVGFCVSAVVGAAGLIARALYRD